MKWASPAAANAAANPIRLTTRRSAAPPRAVIDLPAGRVRAAAQVVLVPSASELGTHPSRGAIAATTAHAQVTARWEIDRHLARPLPRRRRETRPPRADVPGRFAPHRRRIPVN